MLHTTRLIHRATFVALTAIVAGAAGCLSVNVSKSGNTTPQAAPAPGGPAAPAPAAPAAPSTAPAPAMQTADAPQPSQPLQLGNFSISLNVKDLNKSREFYEKLGFRVRGGQASQNWLIMQNGTTNIGIFQGMFPKNMMTFNPGWTGDAKPLASFQDVREIQETLKARGVALTQEADPNSTGVAYVMVVDPDGNPILIDQHVPKPVK